MQNIRAGSGAGFIETVVLSAMMLAKAVIGIMPMAGAGPSGMSFGIMAPLMAPVLQIVFGAVSRTKVAPAAG